MRHYTQAQSPQCVTQYHVHAPKKDDRHAQAYTIHNTEMSQKPHMHHHFVFVQHYSFYPYLNTQYTFIVSTI